MSEVVLLETENGLATMRMSRAHGNAINDELLDGLMACCQEIEADDGIRGAMLAAGGKLFSPGLDLQELVKLDRGGMNRFMQRFNSCILSMYTMRKLLLAAIQGHAVAGGCILSLTADWRILRRGAKIGLNEVKVGVPFPFGVAMILRESVQLPRLEEVALFGRNYSDDAAVAVGLAHELSDEEGFENRCLERLQELAEKDSRAFAITKRYLRSATVERIRANDPSLTAEFIQAWFSEETRAKIQGIVDGLRNRA